MLYYLHLLKEKADYLEFLNVFSYQTVRAAGAALTAFLLSVGFGNRVIRMLTALKVGQPIRTKEEVHRLAELHGQKTGTPTMGGVLIVGSVIVAVLLWGRLTNPFIQTLLFVTIGMGLLGFADDYKKVKKKNSKGVSGRTKLIVQYTVAIIAIAYLYFLPETSSYIRQLWFPSIKFPVIQDMGIFTLVALPIVIVATSNAVNLTDGLDGLAAGCTITTGLAFSALTYVAGHQAFAQDYLFLPFHPAAGEASIFCAALVGTALGFLWFNCFPARVFMGDTGSLAIGGILGMIAICCKQELLLVVIGFVFVAEAGSVIIQVASYKLTGKRVFKMTPIHHHFELMGWEESKVINRFWIISIIAAVVGMMTLKVR